MRIEFGVEEEYEGFFDPPPQQQPVQQIQQRPVQSDNGLGVLAVVIVVLLAAMAVMVAVAR